MNTVTSPPKQRPAVANLFAGVLGGLVVLVVGAILIATDVIDTGDTTTRRAPGTDLAGRRPIRPRRARARPSRTSTARRAPASCSSSPRACSGDEPAVRPAAAGHGHRLRLRGRRRRHDPHQRPRGGGRVARSRSASSEGGEAVDAEVKGVDDDTDIAVLKIDPEGPGPARCCRSATPRSSRSATRSWRSATRSASAHRHHGHRVGAPAPGRRAQRLPDQRRDPDRRVDQPRQLGRPAARRAAAT